MAQVNNNKPWFRISGMAALMVVTLLLAACQHCGMIDDDCSHGDECTNNAKVCFNPTMWTLATDLDLLEKQIEWNGSVVAEQPSVWGQARLTKYRQDFELQMETQLNKFEATLQGSLSRSDQAYVADAFALQVTAQAAASKPPPNKCGLCAPPPAPSASASSSSPLPVGITLSPDLQGTFSAFDNMTRNPARLANPIGFATIGQNGLSLEPTVFLDQMKRYLDHLNELRRINEGDDTADSPGYSLNLVRIPVSVLPGKKTLQGHGAEITLSLKPHLHPELLPMTFKNLVINDLVELLGVPITQFVNDVTGEALLQELVYKRLPGANTSSEKSAGPAGPISCPAGPISGPAGPISGPAGPISCPTGPINSAPNVDGSTDSNLLKDNPTEEYAKRIVQNRLAYQTTRPLMQRQFDVLANPTYVELYNLYRSELLAAYRDPVLNTSGSLVSSPRRRAEKPMTVRQIADVYGVDNYIKLAIEVYNTCGVDIANFDVTHYTDVQSFLQDQLRAAYTFLEDSSNADLWQHCDYSLASAIRAKRNHEIETRREEFLTQVWLRTQPKADNPNAGSIKSGNKTTAILAWGILVNAALLNDKLIEDMKNSASARGGFQPPTEWQPYFLPDPPTLARDAFNNYVLCRWPIHVFALDPAADQQNIADTYSSRREAQLAVSLAFMSGQLSANNLFRYARRLETEVETIAINNTAVGFSHGGETFGWRFYPRFQTPDTPGNLTVFFRDLLVGGPKRDALLRHNRLEPGVRECVAIVMMPSFVPYADLDSSSNFFRLAEPKCKVMDTRDAAILSEKVRSIQNCAPKVTNANCYRTGELDRFLSREKQLEARLPLQTMSVQVPYENTLGGFAMFNSGVTDLAPELLGWYGTPAINLDAPTTLFLIGDHFSVLQTRVLAGGLEITSPELLSRQVMKVTIPAGALAIVQETGMVSGGWKPPHTATKKPASQDAVPASGTTSDSAPAASSGAREIAVKDKGKSSKELLGPDYLYVDIQLATPYGTTSHLLVPAAHVGKPGEGSSGSSNSGSSSTTPATSALPGWASKELTLGFVYQGLGIAPAPAPMYQPKELSINLGAYYSLAGGTTVTLSKMKLEGGGKGNLPDMAVAVTAANYNATTRTLKIAGADLQNLANLVFNEVQYQFGPESSKPPGAVTISGTTVVAPGTPDTKLNTTLKVNWVKAAGPPTSSVNVLVAPAASQECKQSHSPDASAAHAEATLAPIGPPSGPIPGPSGPIIGPSAPIPGPSAPIAPPSGPSAPISPPGGK